MSCIFIQSHNFCCTFSWMICIRECDRIIFSIFQFFSAMITCNRDIWSFFIISPFTPFKTSDMITVLIRVIIILDTIPSTIFFDLKISGLVNTFISTHTNNFDCCSTDIYIVFIFQFIICSFF